ncbi:Biofilm growth-associated repressor [Boseongicola aestuarii]|uniref:Biofilm growth-associated repressor n=2 Tax=Boseongicola aestuarii TaxID=1470561 RepID=A0A238IUI3_9RHOB|nr:Biofilm growth-associated repressor [Boseongicola aestuarii]
MKINEMNTAADGVCEMMTLLSNKRRLMILCLLTEGEKSVGELAEAIGARDTVVSQQLAVLRRERIVKPRRDGQTMFYRIVREDVGKLLDHLYEIYCGGAAITKEIENDSEKS